ncbi:membrane protein [Microbacterium phage LuzDeMundo]|nr:membrane protein [Microbacterium phage Badulia]UJQ86520.1 membrane protein [Microbacterium phage DesireeRose]UVG34205.1 membrane protein [Microbacterium phage LuzDeMundo]WGH20709.1 membrane protein [Microbacterium phage SCoupsA]WGH21172.1 membrane protein [Microbacterium phage Bee17]
MELKFTKAKAIYGAVAGFLTAFIVAVIPYVQDGQTLAQVPTVGWLTAIVAALGSSAVVGGVVYRIPNQPVE